MQPALIAHPDITNPGGGTAVFAWSLAALAQRYAVTVVTLRSHSLQELDARFGTTLAGLPIQIVAPPLRLQHTLWSGGARAERVKTLALGVLARRTRRRVGAALALSTCNELDLGAPALQYVHYPLASYVPALSSLRGGKRALAAAYLALTESPWRRALQRAAGNLALCNSTYTRDAYRRAYGRDAHILHPPVQTLNNLTPWEQRAQRVVCLGRFAPEKRLMDAVEIVEHARRRGADLQLELIGARDCSVTLEQLQQAAKSRPWLRLQIDLDRPALLRRLQDARYGMHTAIGEHFGIAVGELMRAGCVTLAHRSAGPPEILAHDQLLFSDVHEAAERLVTLTQQRDLALALRAHCTSRARLFSERAFMEGLLAHCATFAQAHQPAS